MSLKNLDQDCYFSWTYTVTEFPGSQSEKENGINSAVLLEPRIEDTSDHQERFARHK